MTTQEKDQSRWPVGRLGDLLRCIEAGVSPKSLDRPARDGEYGVLKVSAVTWDEFRPEENKALPVHFDVNGIPTVRSGDLLISRANTADLLASPVLATRDYPNLLLSDKTLRLVPDESVADRRYLLYALRHRDARRYFASRATGTSGSMRNVTQNTINECPILIPPLVDQRRIADILDEADALRRKRAEAIRLTNDLVPSLFYEMFGDTIANPRRWGQDIVGNIADVQGGLQLSGARAAHPLQLPYLRVANVHRDRLWLDEVKTIGLTENELARVRLAKDDILVVEGHGNPNEIGRTAIWDGSIDPCVHQNHLIRVRADRKQVHPVYLNVFLNSPAGRRQLTGFGKTTSGLNTISVSNVRSTRVLIPDLTLQERFASVLADVRSTLERQQVSAVELDNLFYSLLQRAFRGEL